MPNNQSNPKTKMDKDESQNEWSNRREGPQPVASGANHARAHEDRDDEEKAKGKARPT